VAKGGAFGLQSGAHGGRTVSRASPQPSCYEVSLAGGFAIDEMAEVALEDYARAVARAEAAEAVRAEDRPAVVRALHLCGVAAPPTAAMLRDIEGFAASLVTSPGGGLGWS
jgi:hypothetical protein